VKHGRSDYEQIQDPTGKIGDDEPVFLLRAQDELAPLMVRHWAETYRSRPGHDPEVARNAWEQGDEMVRWQIRNRRKMADLPSKGAS
jgi:hypothetical protein